MHEINTNVKKSENINKKGKGTMKEDIACNKTEFKKENASAVASAFGKETSCSSDGTSTPSVQNEDGVNDSEKDDTKKTEKKQSLLEMGKFKAGTVIKKIGSLISPDSNNINKNESPTKVIKTS